MLLKELFHNLSVGEFSNLSLSNEGSGTINSTAIPKMVSYTNKALDMIYKRFVLSNKEVLIELNDFITEYELRSKFSRYSKSPEPIKYIMDTRRHRYMDDCIRILEVSNTLHRKKLPMNDPSNRDSVYTPRPLVLQVPEPRYGEMLSVIYQAKSVPLFYLGDEIKILNQVVDIPTFLENALQNYIAYLTYSHMNGQDHQSKAQEYLSLYSNDCDEIELNDLIQQSQSDTQHKLHDRGFV